ncbi:PREDICTED: protein SRC2 homolog [Tarenaya hassleriana]|uniref:protein SRC2 homolog n=1 Tax=Tarenaya hassleriana TaxID=28532 RepID=UPI00053CA07D|nr:PREDICTED: protein SRC2 homolog [Tarenaya hassleriana]
MSSRKEVEVAISSAKDIKNVNWRHGPNKPYAVVWVDPRYKCSTRVDEEGDTSPHWNETLAIPLPPEKPVDDDDNVLCIDIVHAGREEDTKPLIGSARLSLRDVLEESGVGVPTVKSLKLKRPSGRPHGKLEVTVTVREPRYPSPGSYQAPSYGYGAPHAPPAYGAPYAPPQYAAPPSGYPYNAAAPAPAPSYGQQPGYGYAAETERKGSRFGGMGTGLAVGAVAGALGGIALVEGVDALEDHIAEEAAEKVEDDLAAGDDFDGGDDDDY